jgi:tRNA pseudouridine55 synthase
VSGPESGLVIVDKPAGVTSHDVVARIRRVAGTRKVGHAGTLDPMATGVLVLGVNRATRLLGHLVLADKTYDATVRLGQATVTDDAEGDVVSTSDARHLTDAAVREAAAAFVGAIEQVPSAVSAIKVGGQRSYKRVRAGEQVELAARPVTVHELTAGDLRRTGDADGLVDVDVTVRCSSGTYVRALARDLGAALGVGGHLTALRRTAVGPIHIDEARPLAEIEDSGDPALMAMGRAGERFFPSLPVDDGTARAVSYGQKLELTLPDAGPVALLGPGGDLLALYRQDGPRAVPVAVFTG